MAHGRGIEPLMVACHYDNPASATVILGCGRVEYAALQDGRANAAALKTCDGRVTQSPPDAVSPAWLLSAGRPERRTCTVPIGRSEIHGCTDL